MGGKSKEEKDEESQNKAFADDINYFLSKEQFNFYDFHERVLVSCVDCVLIKFQNALKQKSSIKMMIWGDDAEVKVLESQNKVVSAMNDEEKTTCKFTAE